MERIQQTVFYQSHINAGAKMVDFAGWQMPIQYPDGIVLFAGTMVAPTQDRDQPGEGFTHKVGDVVEISCPELGTLVNRVDYCDAIAPWTFGTGALMRNLAARGLLGATS